MAKPRNTQNIGRHLNSQKTRFKKGHEFIDGGEKGWFKKGKQNNPTGGFSKGNKPWNKGKTHLIKEKHPHWKGGITPENVKIRNSIEMKLWKKSVFQRDDFTCQKYGIKGGRLVAHHINNFSEFLELRFAIDNGITLSEKAHKQFHSIYGVKNNTVQQLNEFLK
jgi:hypothetical protein